MTNDKKNTKTRREAKLGWGMAEKARKLVRDRPQRINDEIDKAAGFKRNK